MKIELDLEALFKSGKTLADIQEDVYKSLRKEKERIDAEAAREQDLEDAREDLVDTLLWYAECVVGKPVDLDRELFINAFKEAEKEIKSSKGNWDMFKGFL